MSIAPSQLPSPDAQPLRVLLIDDDRDYRGLVRDAILECGLGVEVIETSCGSEGIATLAKLTLEAVPPALIFLDVEMPGMDGLATLRQIRQQASHSHIPVVMMTGLADEIAMQQAADLHANAYTLKPNNAEELLRIVGESVRYWINVHQRPHRHRAQSQCHR